MNSTGAVLSAQSLLVAILGVVYGAWYADIRDAESIKALPLRPERDPQIAQVKGVLYSKVVPLFLIATATVLIFLPPAVSYLPTLVRPYNPAQAAAVLIEVAALGLIAYLGWHGLVLVRKISGLNS